MSTPRPPSIGGGTPVVLWDLDGTLVRIRRPLFRVLMPAVAAWSFRDVVRPWIFLRHLPAALAATRSDRTAEKNTTVLVRAVAARCGVDEDAVGAGLRHLAGAGFTRLSFCFPPEPEALRAVSDLHDRRVPQVVATNPLWPLATVHSRLRGGGLDPSLFRWCTSGESCSRSKPDPEFYRELVTALDVDPRRCLMIGNDRVKDGIAASLGIRVYLLGPSRAAEDPLVTTGDWAGLRRWLDHHLTHPDVLEEDPCSS